MKLVELDFIQDRLSGFNVRADNYRELDVFEPEDWYDETYNNSSTYNFWDEFYDDFDPDPVADSLDDDFYPDRDGDYVDYFGDWGTDVYDF